MAKYLFECPQCHVQEYRSIPVDVYVSGEYKETCTGDKEVMTKVFELPRIQLNYASLETSDRGKTNTYDSYVMNKIETASAVDGDVDYVLNKGTPSMQKRMYSKMNQLNKEKKHLDSMYGAGMWDGKNNKGELVKTLNYTPSEEGALL